MQQDRIFHLEVATASALMSGDVLAMRTIYNFYIRLTEAIMYRTQSSFKKHLINLLRGVKLKETLAATRKASSEIYVPQYFKLKTKNFCHSIQYFLLIEVSLDICICSHMQLYLSQVQQNLLLERSWNGDNLVL